jgi:SHS2 domain-containing protein
MKKLGFRFLDHTADVQVECWAPTLEEAFSQTALSLMTIISPNLNLISPSFNKEILIEAEDKESLLFDFLSEFLYIFDVEELIFSEISVGTIKKKHKKLVLRAHIKGEIFNKDKHEVGTEVKGVTYSYMEIKENKGIVKIKVVFDI